jgi:hypothetical protein
MISTVNSNYEMICKHFKFEKATFKNTKSILLAIAECGSPRPHYATSLYIMLCSFTNKNNIQYDKDFNDKIRSTRPEWFVPRTRKSEVKKNKLLSLAKNKKPRPTHKDKLYRELCDYTNKNNTSYDEDFDKKIRKLRPDWFYTRSDIAKINKIKILNLKIKPKRSNKLGIALKNYISKSSQAYDPYFTRQVRILKPNWFKK